ncbi:MAG: isoprenylcysteine carboxylmethyltransferase family protein [Candidatus Margulisiibacteriota bacterium]
MITNILITIVVLTGLEQLYETAVLGQRKEKGILRGEKWTIWGMGIAHFLTFIFTLAEFFLVRRSLNLEISMIGISMYALGVIGRYWTINTLGKYWSIFIEMRENQKLITDGPFNFMRHPSYFSLFFKVLSVPLILNSYFTFLFVLIFYCPLVFIRLYYEEIELFKKFKKTYASYRRGKWSLFPFNKGKTTKFLANKIKPLRKILNRW